MEEKEKMNRDRWLHLRLTAAEHEAIKKAFSATTQRKISDYARKILLGKPMVSTYRNASIDALMQELLLLRKDLNGLANNFNQAVHKLHTLDHPHQLETWAEQTRQQREALLQKVQEMRLLTARLGAEWLR